MRRALGAAWVAVRATTDEHALFIESGDRSLAATRQTLQITRDGRSLGDVLIDWSDSANSAGGREAALVLSRQIGHALDRAERRETARLRTLRRDEALFSLPAILCQQADVEAVIAASLVAARDAIADDADEPAGRRGAAIVRCGPDGEQAVAEYGDSDWTRAVLRAILDRADVRAGLSEDGKLDLLIGPSARGRGPKPSDGAEDKPIRIQAAPLADNVAGGGRSWLVTLDASPRPRALDEGSGEIERLARLIGAVTRAADYADQQRCFLDEFAHRVRNNLLTLAQMVGEERSRSANSADLARIQDWLSALIGIYGALEDSDFSRVDPRRLVDRVAGVILGGWSVVEIDLEPISLNSPEGTVLGIIVVELLQNVRKHAYSGREGRVRISGRVSGSRRIVVVEDWGAGLPADCRPRGTGIRLMRRLLKGVGGTLQFANRPAPETGVVARVVLRECPRGVSASLAGLGVR